MAGIKLVVLIAFVGWSSAVFFCFDKGKQRWASKVASSLSNDNLDLRQLTTSQLKRLGEKGSLKGFAAQLEVDQVLARMVRLEKYPTEILSNPPEIAIKDQDRWLIKVKCQGVAKKPELQFIAIFQVGRRPGEGVALSLERGMRVHLDVDPVAMHEDAMKQQVVVDGSGDGSLPVFWVKGYRHDEPLLSRREHPMRDLASHLLPYYAYTPPLKTFTGDTAMPLHFWSGWDLYWPDAEERLMSMEPGKPLRSVIEMDKILKAKGIQMLFAPIPQAASLYSDLALGGNDGAVLKDAGHQSAVRGYLRELEKEGVHVVNLHDFFGARRFVNFEGVNYPVVATVDSHWSSIGAALAAEEIARQVRRLPGTAAFTTTSPTSLSQERFVVPSVNSLDKSLNVLSLRGHLKGSPMLFAAVKAATPAGHELLNPSSRGASVHLIGDSNATVYGEKHGGVHAHLVRTLGTRVHLTSINGSSANAVPMSWLKEFGDDERVKVVVWLVAERFLTESIWAEFSDALIKNAAN